MKLLYEFPPLHSFKILTNSHLNIEKCISEFEMKYNFTFRDSYKRLLDKYNGGDTLDTSFRINKVSSDLIVFWFFKSQRKLELHIIRKHEHGRRICF